MYQKCARILLAQTDIRTVVDIGAGREWQFSEEDKRNYSIKLIGVDLVSEELAYNHTVDASVVCDVTKDIPLEDESADLFMCHSVVEHFADNASFLRHAYRVLRPGGYLIAQFPNSFAPFALLNRLLPSAVSRLLLRALIPGSEGKLGFPAHYNCTRYSQFDRIARDAGYDVDYYFPGYFSADYFGFLLPLYLFMAVYDLLRFALGSRNLASYNLFVLRKPGGGPVSQLWGKR